MRLILLIITLTLSLCSFAQSKYSPFSGGVEIGTGASTVIDFNRATNGQVAELKWILNQLNDAPVHIGLFSDKYLNKSDYLEFGMRYARRGASYVNRINYSSTSRRTSIEHIKLYCADIVLQYYKGGLDMFKTDFHTFIGITPSILYEVKITEDYYDIPDNYYHKALLSLNAGIAHHKHNRRLKLELSSALTSITKLRYRDEIQTLNEGYKGIILPVEVMILWGWVID